MNNRSEGARLLRLAKETEGLTEEALEERLAARAKSYVTTAAKSGGGSSSRYMSGERRPDLLRAICAEDEFKIPVRTWFQPARSVRRKSATHGQIGQTT